MAKRRRIGIVFAEEESWAGGFYYVLNGIKSLNFIDDKEKPAVIVFLANDKYKKNINEIDYPYLEIVPINPVLDRRLAFANKIFRKNIFNIKKYKKGFVDFVYPINYYCTFPSFDNLKKIYWIPDFQHLHLPQNFSQNELEFRDEKIKFIIENSFELVLSSKDAKKDFNGKYPHAKNIVHVLNFPSILPELTNVEKDKVLLKFDLDRKYFLCSNQFWKHKNHIVILEALKILKDKNQNILVVFTGNMNGLDSNEYVNFLFDYVKKNRIESFVSFLGYIDRKEQLCLIKGSISVIQPSLFEGWSTIVEDCKALNHFILLSDLGVHKEQVNTNCLFFRSQDPIDLANKLEELALKSPVIRQGDLYKKKIINFAKGIVSIV